MTYEEALSFIHGIPRFGKKPGLKRIVNLLERLGNPQKQLRFIHVAGTNGKGSTCTMLSYILHEAGYRTGLYISPFVIDFRERMQINNEMIPQDELAVLTKEVYTHWHAMEDEGLPPSEFEVVVSIALLYFARQKCDIVVLEVGMGGRFDSTNVIDVPLACAITSIGLDHMQYLGNTLEAIAAEKCGIIKPGSVAVTAPNQDVGALAVIMKHCAETGNDLLIPNSAEIISESIEGSRIFYGNKEYFVPLAGRHQVDNALIVLELCRAIGDRGITLTYDQIRGGMAKTTFPSRLERFGQSPLILMDGAHNEPGAKALAVAMPLLAGRNIHAIISMSADKDAASSLGLVLPYCKSVIVSAAQSNFKAAEAKNLLPFAKEYCSDITLEEQSDKAFAKGLARCQKNDVLLIFGSLYLTSELRPLAIEAGEKQKYI